MKINVRVMLPLFYFFLGLLVMYLFIEVKNNCFIQGNCDKKMDKIAKVLVRQAARWSTAAEQDESLLISVLHANYGAGYLWALKDILPSEKIEKATGVDLFTFEKQITGVQDKITKQLIKTCPNYSPPASYLGKIGGETA